MKVLVVDDDLAVRTSLSRIMSKVIRGAETEGAASAKEAIQKFDQDQFDVVVTDFHMPGGDGSLVYDHVVGDCPCIILTGDPNETSVVRFVKRTGASPLAKPIPVGELVAAIESELAQRAASRT